MADEDDSGKQQRDNSAKARRLRELDDLKVVMQQPEGRRFMWRLLEQCGVYRTSFTGNSETFFREGQRNVGLWALTEMQEAAPDQFLMTMQEAKRNE